MLQFKIPPRHSPVYKLQLQIEQLQRQVDEMTRRLAEQAQPARDTWQRTAAPELDIFRLSAVPVSTECTEAAPPDPWVELLGAH